MNYIKSKALNILNDKEVFDRIPYKAYQTLYDGLSEIETLRDRDEELENLWAEFADIPIDPDTECIEEPFMGWGVGISREEIWHWFDQRHSKGVAYLLYTDGIDRTAETANLLYRNQLCCKCNKACCAYHANGMCRKPFVTGKAPCFGDDAQSEEVCLDFCPMETTPNSN